ncbi:MAG: hypothetical protein HY840_08825 [Bacteroidetes bacterium]|nr:hypothetical protein [Bacteroidota bacterium]
MFNSKTPHNMKNNDLNSTGGIYDEQLEAMLETRHQELLKQARIKGMHFAKQNRPHLKGDSLEFYTGDIVAGHDGMMALVNQKLQHETSKGEAQMLIAAADEKTKEKEQKKQAAETELHNFELKKEQNGESIHKTIPAPASKNVNAVLGIIGLAETVLNITALQLIGGSWISALIMSVGITCGIFVLAKQLARYLKESANDIFKKRLVAIGVTLLVTGVFYMMAVLRAKNMEQQAHFHINPIWFVFMNLVFWVGTVWYIYKNTIPKHQQEEYAKHLQEREHYDNLKNQESRLEAEIKSIKEELSKKLSMLLYKPEYAKHLIERIRRWSAEAVEAFKSANLTHRPDRMAPDCFHNRKTGGDNYSSFTYLKD